MPDPILELRHPFEEAKAEISAVLRFAYPLVREPAPDEKETKDDA